MSTKKLSAELERRVLEILQGPESDRDRALRELCAAHPAEQTRIRGRVAIAARILERLETPGEKPAPPRRIGPYRILRELGEGGMGTVYLAEQEEPLKRRVALKVVKLGMDTKGILARFETERQALALMSHPGIARVLDAGSTEQGRPYFTMEYVAGEPITEYCDRMRMDLRGRLELLRQVLEAVQHAHQKGIVHRDLKPSNVLVTEEGGRPLPKVIDFGLARAMERGSMDESLLTREDVILGTPEYMSPEQAEQSRDIDTRTDIYAVGVLLYELLTGMLPFDRGTLREAGYAEIRRVIREEEPLLPSTRITQQGDTAREASKRRGTELRTLVRSLRGDLNWITMKALEKDRSRRYDTARALSDDIRRHLDFEPVEAGPPTARYRLEKFARKHRGPVAAGVVVFLVLVAGLSATIWQAGIAKVNEKEARENLSDFRRMADVRRLQDLEREADEELWPLSQAQVPAMQAWIRRSEDLLGRLEIHEEKLNELQTKAKPYTSEMRERDRRKHPKAGELQELEGKRDGLEKELEEFNKAAKRSRTARRKVKAIEAKLPGVQEQIALLLAEIDGDRSYTFDDAEKQWQHDVVQGLGRGLERLADPKSGRLAGMRERLHQARTLRKRSVEEPTAKKAWSEAISAIRSDERYRGLELRPIEGLLPIGPDPVSKLQEFAHLLSGEPAVRDPDSDKLLLDERSGIVLVLIPGGSFRMGAQKSDETGHNYDPQAEVDESDKDGNTVEVTLDAFFLSKYEMTQGQWQRIAGDNPSEYPPDERTWDTRQGPKPVTLLHPVENVGWLECREMLARLDLVLPTEAQWEYAARAGTDTPWWTGRDKSELAGAANLADGFCKRHGGHPSWPFDEELDDGFLILAPVGSLRPNGFGLFDVLGNVFEWCRDSTPGYGFRLPPSARVRMSRGGSWLNVAAVARSAYRGRESPTGESNKGVRPARTIRP